MIPQSIRSAANAPARRRSPAGALAAALLLSSLMAAGGAAAQAPRPAAGPAPAGSSLRVAVLELEVVDNSFDGDSRRLREWMHARGIDPTRLLREKMQEAETYAAFARPPAVTAVPAAAVAEAVRGTGVERRLCAGECALRVARAVAADRVVTGEVTKLSTLIWFVTARVLDARSGRLLREDELEVKGVIEDLMPKVMTSLARRVVLAGAGPGSSAD